MRSRKFSAATVLCFVVIGVVLYRLAAEALTRRVRNDIVNSLSQASGGTGRFSLRIDRLTVGDMLAGRVRHLYLTMEDTVFAGLRYRTIAVRSDLIQVDRAVMRQGGSFTVRRLGPTSVTARVDEGALNDYRAGRWPTLPVAISLKNGRVTAQTRLDLSLGRVDIGFSGRLKPEKDAIRLQPEALEIQNLELPRQWIESAVGPLDQVFSLAFPVRLPLPVHPSQVTIHDGWVEVTLTRG